MNALSIIAILKKSKISVLINGDDLLIDHLNELTDEQRNLIKSHKTELVNHLKLDRFLTNCCNGLPTTPDEVKARLLSSDDISMIAKGEYGQKLVRAHIQLWIEQGRQNYKC